MQELTEKQYGLGKELVENEGRRFFLVSSGGQKVDPPRHDGLWKDIDHLTELGLVFESSRKDADPKQAPPNTIIHFYEPTEQGKQLFHECPVCNKHVN